MEANNSLKPLTARHPMLAAIKARYNGIIYRHCVSLASATNRSDEEIGKALATYLRRFTREGFDLPCGLSAYEVR
jgi:hypothetical protein